MRGFRRSRTVVGGWSAAAGVCCIAQALRRFHGAMRSRPARLGCYSATTMTVESVCATRSPLTVNVESTVCSSRSANESVGAFQALQPVRHEIMPRRKSPMPRSTFAIMNASIRDPRGRQEVFLCRAHGARCLRGFADCRRRSAPSWERPVAWRHAARRHDCRRRQRGDVRVIRRWWDAALDTACLPVVLGARRTEHLKCRAVRRGRGPRLTPRARRTTCGYS